MVEVLWVVRLGGDDGELRPWHYIYEGGRAQWGTPTMALHICGWEGTLGNSDHGTTYMRVGGDDWELRPWHSIHEGGRGRWGTLPMALNI